MNSEAYFPFHDVELLNLFLTHVPVQNGFIWQLLWIYLKKTLFSEYTYQHFDLLSFCLWEA